MKSKNQKQLNQKSIFKFGKYKGFNTEANPSVFTTTSTLTSGPTMRCVK
ncbi:hypothetical protein [Sphingobacterium sp.]